MKKIKSLRRLDDTILRLGGVGDNWHMSWAADDRQFVSLCDGSGFPGMPRRSYNSRGYAIHGDPPGVAFEYLPGYPELLTGDTEEERNRYYNFGILALDGEVYQYLSTPNHPFRQPSAAPSAGERGPARFAGVKLITSPDNGGTWRNQDGSSPVRWEPWAERSRENMLFFEEPGEAFSLITVLQMGRNYEHNTDGCVYLYAPNGNVEGTMNELVLCRVPRGRILERGAYEFFAERRRGGSAGWSSEIADRAVVCSFPSGWVNRLLHPYAWHPSVVYYAPMEQYLMVNWGMGCTEDGWWFGRPSYLGFWTAPQPWGPWTQVHEEAAWTPAGDGAARAYQPQIAPKWIAPYGGSFWLVWTDFQEMEGRRPYYAFNLQKVEVTAE